MSPSTQRLLLRVVHLVFSVPVIGYVYSPFENLPDYAPKVRFVILPLLGLSGLWMWKLQIARRRLTKASA
jgi:hypothetical protein